MNIWTIVVATIGVAGTAIASSDKVMAWYRDRRSAEERAASLWTMQVSQLVDGTFLCRVAYDDRHGPPLHVVAIETMAPRGLRLCDHTYDGPTYDPGKCVVGAVSSTSLPQGRDLNARTLGGNEVEFVVKLPAKPLWPRRTRTRLKVAIVGEERTAMRRRNRVPVASQEVIWS